MKEIVIKIGLITAKISFRLSSQIGRI